MSFVPGKLYRTKVFVRRAWKRGEARTSITRYSRDGIADGEPKFWWSPITLPQGTVLLLLSTRALEEGVNGVVATFFGHGDRHFIFLEDNRVVKVVLPRNLEMEVPRRKDAFGHDLDNLMRFEEMFEEMTLPEEH